MDRFLILCFKLVKLFISLVLLVLLVAGVRFGVMAIQSELKVNDYKMNYEFSETGLDNLKSPKYTYKENNGKQDLSFYNGEVLKAFASNTPSANFVESVSKYIVKSVEGQDIEDFIANLPTYYEKFKQSIFAQAKKEYTDVTDEQLIEWYQKNIEGFDNEVLTRYAGRYEANVKLRDAHKTETVTARNASLMALLIVLGLFIVTLIVPMLIKIEENTRPKKADEHKKKMDGQNRNRLGKVWSPERIN